MSGNLVRILADRDRCIGAGQCVLSAPDVFDQSDDDGRVLILPHAAAPHSDPANTTIPPQSKGPLEAATPPASTGLSDAAPPQPKGPLDAAASPNPAGLLDTPAPPVSEGPLVDEDVARAAVDLCPSRALSLARP